MLTNPKPGARAQLWYAKSYRHQMPHHGKLGIVLRAGQHRPRNHLVRLDCGLRVVVPCGNLRKPKHT